MQPIGGGDHISLDMSRVHNSSPTFQPKYSIERVDIQLRTINEKAYEPKIIAIGPYHRDKKRTKRMERQKLIYRDSLRQRVGRNVDEDFRIDKEFEDQATKSYAKLPKMEPNKLVDMLLLDGCFILELFIKFHLKEVRFGNTTLLHLKRDLLLFGNQIPFFVLIKLFIEIQGNWDFVKLATGFFEDIFPGRGYSAKYKESELENNIHLLGLIHDNWLPSFAGEEPRYENKLEPIPSATKLREAGVIIERAVGEKIDLLNIKFEGGTLQIPPLNIEHEAECFFTNLIAYERCYHSTGHMHIISYAKFLNYLIKSEEDLQLLNKLQIIQWTSFDIQGVYQIFDRINESIKDSGNIFHYIDVFRKVNARCTLNRFMAGLREQLRSPTGCISVLAYVLALLQTIYTVASYYKNSS